MVIARSLAYSTGAGLLDRGNVDKQILHHVLGANVEGHALVDGLGLDR